MNGGVKSRKLYEKIIDIDWVYVQQHEVHLNRVKKFWIVSIWKNFVHSVFHHGTGKRCRRHSDDLQVFRRVAVCWLDCYCTNTTTTLWWTIRFWKEVTNFVVVYDCFLRIEHTHWLDKVLCWKKRVSLFHIIHLAM